MKGIILLLLAMTVFGCSKDDEPNKGIDIIATANIWVRNSKSENLLNPLTTGAYDPKGIRVFFLVDGKREEVFNPNIDQTGAFFVSKFPTNGEYYFSVGTNKMETKNGLKSTAYIQWNSQDEDTLVSNYVLDGASLYLVEAIWNGKRKYKANDPDKVQYWGTNAFNVFFPVDK